VNIPTALSISVLETSINKSMKDRRRWVIVGGFPESIEELHEFEEKVGTIPSEVAWLTLVGAKAKLYIVAELQ